MKHIIKTEPEGVNSWSGYLRPDGRKGIRNLVLIVYTVECAQHVSYAIANGEPKMLSGRQEYLENLINRFI